jgi:hypothetical protein
MNKVTQNNWYMGVDNTRIMEKMIIFKEKLKGNVDVDILGENKRLKISRNRNLKQRFSNCDTGTAKGIKGFARGAVSPHSNVSVMQLQAIICGRYFHFESAQNTLVRVHMAVSAVRCLSSEIS